MVLKYLGIIFLKLIFPIFDFGIVTFNGFISGKEIFGNLKSFMEGNNKRTKK